MNTAVSLREHRLLKRRFELFDIEVADATLVEAADLLDSFMERGDHHTRLVYFVNAHTINCANRDPDYRRVLQRGDCVFGDGVGVRLAARFLAGLRLRANVNGTDLVPYAMARSSHRRVFVLGTEPSVLDRASVRMRDMFPGWRVCGTHHGYFPDDRSPAVIDMINRAQPDLLLVAMGNPRQEIWLDQHRDELDVPLCMGVGALADYFAGTETRAPAILCHFGLEWLYRMLFQRGKFMRYFIGNPEFLWSMVIRWWRSG